MSGEIGGQCSRPVAMGQGLQGIAGPHRPEWFWAEVGYLGVAAPCPWCHESVQAKSAATSRILFAVGLTGFDWVFSVH